MSVIVMFSELGDHLVKHGDGVKDIAFTVEDCDFLVQVMVQVLFYRCIMLVTEKAIASIINIISQTESPGARGSHYKGTLHSGGQIW